MQEATLEMLSVKGAIGIDSSIRIMILDIGKALAGLSPSVKSNMNLYSIST